MIRTRVALLLVGASAAAGLLVGAAGTLKATDGTSSIPQQCIEFMQQWGWNGSGSGMMGGQYPSGMGPGMMGSGSSGPWMMGGSSSSMSDWMRDHMSWEESR